MAKKKLSAFELKFKKLATLAMAKFATKTELSQNAGEHLHPVDVNSLTPSSTFTKNAVIGINGVLYRATQAVSNLPVTLTVLNGAFVTHSVNGKIAFVIADETLNSGWEIFTDASIEYWVNSLNAALANKQNVIDDLSTIRSNASGAVKKADTYTYNNQSYTVDAMLTELAKFMSKTVVTQG